MAIKTHSSVSQAKTSPTLQRLFIVAASVALIMQTAQSVYFTMLQYNNNPNMSGYLANYIGIVIMLLLIGTLYISKKDRSRSLKNAFDICIVATSIVFIGVGIGWLTMFVPLPIANLHGDFFWLILAYQLLPLLVTVPLIVVIIRRLRAKNQW